MDAWWVEFADGMTPDMLGENVSFEFIGGDRGMMTRLEIIIHVVNYTSYHRVFVDEMLGQIKADGPVCDFPVYLREMARPA
ncbi:hypothetical protein ROA7745_03013 [Roseovarius aestuarii]|uniref:Uncharacterized protein n=2 Tax=Roseovarius aestuarii TaxID=475083 RepID=A0A1X7BU22_9RHOB|nr:hypothetical protein ROA7745_03013 [Roseovarius aestuarii]